MTPIAKENLDKIGIFTDAYGRPVLLNLSQVVTIIPDDNDSEKLTAAISFSNRKEVTVDLQVFFRELTGITNEKTLNLPVSLISSSDEKLNIDASLGYDFYNDVWQRYGQMKESQKDKPEDQHSHADCADDEPDDDDIFDMSKYKVDMD